ncbi:MAG: phosphoribosylformylglycinamidine synthase subunit PurL [Candidatus Omnitrophica bacterium]|nr:phosphoribosylformylglycinamidine synthase subunit PurL [Candidatus Omnitrophota bacterium]
MNIWHIEVFNKEGVGDVVGLQLLRDIKELGIDGVERVCFKQVYLLEGEYSAGDIEKIAQRFLADPICQEFSVESLDEKAAVLPKDTARTHTVEIAYNPGVMDPWEETIGKGIIDLGCKEARSVKTIKKYVMEGSISSETLDTICDELLYNKLIQHRIRSSEKSDIEFLHSIPEYTFSLITVDLLSAANEELLAISKNAQLYLSLDEMKAIQAHFVRLGRNPTDCEIETIAQTWSEHCCHKTFRAAIEMEDRQIDNLLKSTVMKVTKELNKEWCLSVFKDNAGIIAFDEKNAIAVKVETHNHPSALEPYGGASTGIGGVIRDILGAGLGARPIANTDVFCFAPFDIPAQEIPGGVLHPRRIIKGVVSGVRDYGNRMGIPTVNGAVLFDKQYLGNPLVYCGTIGIMPKDMCTKKVDPGDVIIAVGGRTGRDGIHGATFSSGELTSSTKETLSGAVQIGNPIAEKKVLDVLLAARDRGLYKAITDCGAGGFSSAVGELGEETGAEVHLEKVPLKYAGLTYTEMWISESQERMVLAAAPDKAAELIELFAKEDVEATCIGTFTDDKRLKLYYNDNLVCDLDMEFLHRGMPRVRRTARWKVPRKTPLCLRASFSEYGSFILKTLAHPNVCSKEWIIRQYDHEVQAGTVSKPLVGARNDGPSDAAVMRPLFHSRRGIAVANGINSKYGIYDPYWMAASNIDEAIRQQVAVGADFEKIALLDNFCWGNPEDPYILGSLVRAAEACYDIARGFGCPFISGKDSLYNEYVSDRKKVSIPGTLLITSIGIVDDVGKAVSMDFKKPGDYVYIIGETRNELAGSAFCDVAGLSGGEVPRVDVARARITMEKLSQAIRTGIVSAAHDCSDGGLAVAVCEMAMAGEVGADIDLGSAPCFSDITQGYEVLFSESNSRFIVSVPAESSGEFERLLGDVKFGLLGRTKAEPDVRFISLDKAQNITLTLADIRHAWKSTLDWQ